jgi:hypothetical protein
MNCGECKARKIEVLDNETGGNFGNAHTMQ